MITNAQEIGRGPVDTEVREEPLLSRVHEALCEIEKKLTIQVSEMRDTAERIGVYGPYPEKVNPSEQKKDPKTAIEVLDKDLMRVYEQVVLIDQIVESFNKIF